MKKTVIFLIAILLISIMGGITVNYVLDKNKLYKQPETIEETAEYKENSVKIKDVKAPDGKQTKITYSETSQNSIHTLDVYIDEKGNEYRFSQSGDKIGYFNLHTAASENVLESENELSKIAVEYAENYFGDQLYGFELIEFVAGSYNGDLAETYIATLAKKYGENGFIRGEVCYVTIASDGVVINCLMPNWERLSSFDPDTVKDITYNDISEYVDEIIKNTYDTELNSYQIDLISVTKANDKFVLVIYVNAENKNNISMIEEYYYEIPQ